MQIRARIALEVNKFKTNAKVVGKQFRAMTVSGKSFSKNVDKYIQQTAKNQRAQVNRTEKEERDSYSRRMQAVRAYQKAKSKAELEAVRNKGGIKPGTTAGKNLAIEQKLSQKSIQIIKKREAAELKASNRVLKARQKEASQAVKFVKKREAAELKASNKIIKSRNKEAALAVKSIKKREAEDLRASNKYLKARQKEAKAAVRAINQAEKAEQKLAAQRRLNSKEFERQMAATRYALYDVGRRALAFGTAMGAALGAAVAQSAKFESAFTSVERTTGLVGSKARELKDELYDMATSIPVAFESISEIATIGAQLGIASDAVSGFTETVAKFSAITGISAEQVSLSFGRLAQLLGVPVSEFENLSSAIAFTGVNSVATDQEILRMSESIGAAAANAGLAADETVGLASALASLKVRPEQARGVFIRLFRTLDVAVEQGGEKMEDFAKVVGMSTEAAQELYRQSPMDFFKQFLYGAKTAGTLNETMAQLGINNVRELDVIQRLSQNMGVLETALSDANEQYLLGTYSSDAYAMVVDDLASKIQMMQNAIAEASAELGDVLAPVIGVIVDGIKRMAEGFSDSAPWVKSLTAAIIAFVAGAGIFYGTLTLGIAGLLALKLAMKNLGASAGMAGIGVKTFTALLNGMIATSVKGAVATKVLTVSVKGLSLALRALPFVGLIAIAGTFFASLFTMSDSADEAKDSMNELGNQMIDTNGGMSEALKAIQKDTAAFKQLTEAGKETAGMFKELERSYTDEQLAAKKTKESVLGVLESYEDLQQGRDKVIDSTGEIEEAYSKNAAAANAEAEAIERSNAAKDEAAGEGGVDEDVAYALGNEYALYLLRGMKNYVDEEGNTSDFFVQFGELDSGTQAALAAVGFDIFDIVENSILKAGEDGKTSGGEAYVQSFIDDFEAIGEGLQNVLDMAIDPEDFTFGEILDYAIDAGEIDAKVKQPLLDAFNDSGLSKSDFIANLQEMPSFILDAAGAVDTMNNSVQSNITADALEQQIISTEGLSDMSEGAEDASALLNEKLKELAGSSTEVTKSNQKISEGLRQIAEDAQGTNGEIFGLSESAKTNMDNFSGFLQDAADDAVTTGTGVQGAITTMITGLTQLDNSGVNTDEMLTQLKTTAGQMLSEAGGDYAALESQLNTVTDVAGLRAIITAFYQLEMAAARAAGATKWELYEIQGAWQNAVAALDGTVEIDVDTTPATGRTQTALQKMQESIEKLFKWTNKKIALEETLASFGETLRENGKYFSLYSDRGREGIQSILTVIDDLAVQSGGDLQKMANYLGTFRQALVNAGVPAAGLRYVDKAIADTGKSAQFSAQDVKDFERSMSSLNSEAGKTERALLRMAEAASNFSSSVSDGLSARFAMVDAMDDITLAQLDMADAAEQASKQISDLNDNIADNNKQVRDAKQAIEDANAEIGKLAADKNTLEYQLDIALKYGDTLRANELRAQIAGIDEEIAGQRNNITDANQDIADAQAENSRVRQEISDIQTTNTREAIEETRALRDLALKFATLTGNMMANAEEGEDLNDIITEQVEDFKNVAKQMGYSSTEVEAMAKILEEELIVAMDEIPDDIKTEITAETSGAMSSINSFVTNATTRLNSIPRNIVTRHTTIESSVSGMSANPTHWSTGGFVQGPGGPRTDSIPAMLSNGEYVIQASAVNRYGVDFFNALNQMSRPPAMVQGAGTAVAGGGNQMVFLSPEDRNLLQQAVNRPVTLYADSTTIATTANEGNKILAQRGLN